MKARIHFFALTDSSSTLLFCGDFREGDGWTALPQGVTCPDCKQRIDAVAAPAGRAAEASANPEQA